MASSGVAAQARQQTDAYWDEVTVWKVVATCHYACAVRHLHAHAGQSLWQAIVGRSRSLAVLGLFRSLP